MPEVTTSTTLENIDLNSLWDILIDFEKYPDMMTDVIDVKCHVDDEHFRSEWTVLLNGSKMSWQEIDIFYKHEKIVFEQTIGDLEIYKGEWRIEKNGKNKYTVILNIEFDLGIPSLEDVLNPLGIKAIKANSEQMLKAIQTKITHEDSIQLESQPQVV